MPCLLTRRGQLYQASPDGIVAVTRPDGAAVDLFDVIDPLAAEHPRLYLVDLDALDGHEPQLDFIQEISREIALWVDAGVRSADDAMDVLVAGAHRAVLSSRHVKGPDELRRAWALSTNWVFEIDIMDGRLGRIHPDWVADAPESLAREVEEIAKIDLVLGYRTAEPDWGVVRSISGLAPTWIGGNVGPSLASAIASAGGAGAIYPLGPELLRWDADPGPGQKDEPAR